MLVINSSLSLELIKSDREIFYENSSFNFRTNPNIDVSVSDISEFFTVLKLKKWRMHPDLSPHLHTPECNKLIEDLKSCHENNHFAKFLGKCNKIDQQVVDCLRQERKNNQALNKKKALERQKRVQENMRLLNQQKQEN